MAAVFLKILELSLYGSILILAILPLRALLKKAPRWSICLLWTLAAIALVCPIRFESPTSVLPADLTVAVPSDTVITPSLPLVQTEPIMIPDFIENAAQSVTPAQPDYAVIGSIIWLIGMAVMVSSAAVSYVRLKKQVAASLLVKENVYLCDDIDSPFILGILRPRIYLPSSLAAELYSSVLLHEHAHLKRRDHWWKPLGYVLLTVHWFNPLVWLGYVLLCRDIELACDEKVIRDMDSRHKKQYSEALLECSMPRRLITACPLAFGEVGAKQRIKAVLHYKKPAFWVILIALAVCMALAVTLLTEPKLTTLDELSEITAADVTAITVHKDLTTGRSVVDMEAVCKLLSDLELRQRIGRPIMDTDWAVISFDIANDTTAYHLYISPDRTRLWLTKQDSVTSIGYPRQGTYYEIRNPDIITTILYGEYLYEIPASNDSTNSEQSGWDMHLQMNADTGNIEIVTSHPVYKEADLYIQIDVSFIGHEALYNALLNAETNFPNLKLLGQQSYGGYEYAVIQYDGSSNTITALVEYTMDGSAVTLLNYAEGYVPDTQGFLTGYFMNCASMEGGIMYWSLYAPHYKTSSDGKEVAESHETADPAFTGFRFTMRDLKTYGFPAEGNFFLCEFTTVIPPAIVTPIENGKLLAALGSEAPSLAYNTYSFVED